MEDKENKLTRLELEELIDKYCYRVGRHGETYLLEKGIKSGLIDKLIQYINLKYHRDINSK